MNRRSRRNRLSRRVEQKEDKSVSIKIIAKPRAILKPNSPRHQANRQRTANISLTNSISEPIIHNSHENKPHVPIITMDSTNFEIAAPSLPCPVTARRNNSSRSHSVFPLISNEVYIKSEIEKGKYVKQKCSFCETAFSINDLAILTCGHVFHLQCLMNFRKNSNPRNHMCPICRQLYHYNEIKAQDIYQNYAATLIQKHFRGYIFRKHIGEIAPPGSMMHKKWVLSRAKNASVLLVDAIENQSDAVDAILASIDRELDWARSVMNAVEVQEKEIDWDSVKLKIESRGCGACPICLRDIDFSDCMITSCEHCFHSTCLKQWLSVCENESNATTCPVCRSAFQFKRLYEFGETDFEEIANKGPFYTSPKVKLYGAAS